MTVEGRPYAGGMEQPQLVLLALLAGLLIGAAVVGLVVAALRARDRSLAQTSAEVPEGVEAMLGAMDDPAFVCDTSSTVLALSPAAEVFGAHAGEVISSEELKRVARVARDTGSGIAENLRLRRGAAPAEPRLVAVRATPISGRLTLVVLRDITERERVEEMRRDFVANTSHELKTPVGAVSLLSEAIEFAADDPAQVRHFASRLQAEVTRLAALVNRILSLSRLQASDELRDVRDVSIDEVVTAAVEGYAIQADAAQVTVVRGGTKGLWVRGEPQILTEAVGNLVANAIAYSPEGSKVGVGVKLDDTVVEIAVTDRGIGIPESDQHRVFERFYRADQARSRRTGGTGLGLSIVKHAVQRHGGEVRLWSRPDRGSTFTIRLPMSEAPDLEGVRPKPRRKGRKSSATTPVPAKGDTA
ncbi:two-component sensor histidine kinase [Microbacterium testaceum]|uniref:Sensor-like histidine kinase SenX3 n=2 Tax=Microbacterium testaceum TaxID=2033 RepID=A0A4Y3QKC1_MICTE|nr:two-component sensor histidine kinase [Microbacterium testaceum]